MASEGTAPARADGQAGTDRADEPAQRDPRRARIGRGLGAIVIVAAASVAVAFGMTAGVSDGDVVRNVVALHDLPPNRPSPAPGAVVAGQPTPDLERYKWTPQGARVDVVGTHTVATTYFIRAGRLLGVSVISGGPVREPGVVIPGHGAIPVHLSSIDGRTVLTWRRDGHTSVMSSIAVPRTWMVELVRALNFVGGPSTSSPAGAG